MTYSVLLYLESVSGSPRTNHQHRRLQIHRCPPIAIPAGSIGADA